MAPPGVRPSVMSLRIDRALQDGIARTFARNGLLLVAAMLVLGALNLLAYNSLASSFVPDGAGPTTMPLEPTLPISPAVAGVALAVLYLLTFLVTAVALRTFVGEETRTIPREYATRNLGWFLLNYVVGYVVFAIVVTIGFVLLVVPGVFLMVSLYFWIVYVAVEDENFVSAFRDSWALTRGNRWSLLGLGLIVVAGGAVLFGVLFAASFVLPAWGTLLLYAAILALYGVFGFATAARAYVQLSGDEPGASSATAA